MRFPQLTDFTDLCCCLEVHHFETVSIASAICVVGSWSWAAEEPPTEWIEPATGHRVIRLSREPGTASLYFHQNAYSADGRKLVVTTPGGLATIDLKTREIDAVVTGRVGVLVIGRKTGQIYYTKRTGSELVL